MVCARIFLLRVSYQNTIEIDKSGNLGFNCNSRVKSQMVFSMKLNSFSPLPDDDEELHLPELVYWASIGDIEQVMQLLAEGIDPNQTDDDGYSALQAAAENDNLAVVKLLVSQGANVYYKSEYTALQLAEMAENHDVVAYLKRL